MSASFASAMMKAREHGFALISASLASRDFTGQFRRPNVECRKKSEFRRPKIGPRWEVSLHVRASSFFRASGARHNDRLCPSGFGLLSDFGFRISNFPSHFHFRQRVLQRLGRVLQAHYLLRPQLDLDMFLDTFAADYRRHAQADVANI